MIDDQRFNNTVLIGIDEFIEGMPINKYGKTVARKALSTLNITDISQLQNISYSDIGKIPKIGWKTIRAIEDRAEEIGISLKERSYRQ